MCDCGHHDCVLCDGIDWGKAIPKGPPSTPIKWYNNHHKNLISTLEWTIRPNLWREDIYRDKSFFSLITDNWYEFLEGGTSVHSQYGCILHICYPKELLKIRGHHENAYNDLVELDPKHMSDEGAKKIRQAKLLKWSTNDCIGGDGDYHDIVRGHYREEDLNHSKYPGWLSGKCSNCLQEVPKAVQMVFKIKYVLKARKRRPTAL